MRKPWFTSAGRPGTRTIEQQLVGLQSLLANAVGTTVLDLGCGEGLIAHELALRGARHILGIDLEPEFIEVARHLGKNLQCSFRVADLNTWRPAGQRWDVVLMLAVLHKLRNPSDVCRAMADACDDLCVIRLPPKGAPVIVDARSGNEPHDIGAVMGHAGFDLAFTSDGPIADGDAPEWVGFYRRRHV